LTKTSNTVYTTTNNTMATTDYLDNLTYASTSSASIVIGNEVLDGPTIAKLRALLDVISDVPEIAEKLNVELAIRKIAGQ
jgi:hypothetical protein